MFNKNQISLHTFIDFSYMFFSTLIKKGFGFIRELIVAFFFGSSVLYANYLLLKTASDFVSQIMFGNALQANIMPKFVKLYSQNKSLNLSSIYAFAKRFSFKLFLILQAIQSLVIFGMYRLEYIDPSNTTLYLLVSLLLGFVASFNLFNAIFLTILQAKGSFKKYSIATTFNISVSTISLYPLILLFKTIASCLSIIGVVISRFLGVLSLAIIYVKPLLNEDGEKKPVLSISDFNFSILILGNFANIIMLLARFFAGLDGGSNIAFYTYAVVILNIFFTAVVMNINTLVLKFISVKKNLRIIIISVLLTSFLGSIFIFLISFFSQDIISFVFERGKFDSLDTFYTSNYMKDLSWSFILMFISSTLFQAYFTLPDSYLKKETRKLIMPLYLVVLILSFYFLLISSGKLPIYTNSFIYRMTYNGHSAYMNSLIMTYGMSFVYFLVSIISFIKYLRYETK